MRPERTTLTEEAIDHLMEVYGPGDMPVVDVAELLERCEEVGIRRLLGKEQDENAMVEVRPVDLRTLIDAAIAAKTFTKLALPPGLVLTKPYLALLSILDRLAFEPPAPELHLERCPHERIVTHGFARPGLECFQCSRWVSDRQIFEAEVRPDGSIDDTSTPDQIMEKRTALVRTMLDDPAQARLATD